MATFVRWLEGVYGEDEAQAKAEQDMERGYSIIDYGIFESREDAEASRFDREYGVSLDSIIETEDGHFVFPLPGLCGYALDAATDSPTEKRYWDWTWYAVYEGELTGRANQDDGDCFRPTALVKVGSVE